MIKIGALYRQTKNGQARVCADISLNGKVTTLWFGVEEAQAEYLCAERSDAFVMALLPAAMRGGYEIVCETPMSARLHYQLTNYLIPSLCNEGKQYKKSKITGPLTAQKVSNRSGVGTGFSGGVDSLYSIMTHSQDSEYPLTHIAVFNVGAFDGDAYRENFKKACLDAVPFAREQDLKLVCLDSNIVDVLPENFLEVYSFRNIVGAMALQSLFSVYLVSSDQAFSKFTFDFTNNGTYDLLMVHCAQTESLAFYSAGGQVYRHQKLEALAEWEPAHRWLHPCFRQRLSRGNCGKCKKCIFTMAALYAYGTLERFETVFDVEAYQKNLPENLGYLLANSDKEFCAEVLQLFRERNVSIPKEAYAEAEAMRKMGANAFHTKTEQRDALLALARNCRKNITKKTTGGE